MDEHALPCRLEGPAEGVGVCLSGGGIRAASFGLGALQALDEGRHLLYGDGRADYLAAVSGGSYVAATATAVASQLASGEPVEDVRPMAPESPEARHILDNGDYLKQWGPRTRAGNWALAVLLPAVTVAVLTMTGAPTTAIVGAGALVAAVAVLLARRSWLLTISLFGASGVINVGGFASLALLSAGALVAVRDLLVNLLGDVAWLEPVVTPKLANDLLWLPLALVGLLGGRLVLRTLYSMGQRFWPIAVGLLLLVAGTPALVYVLNGGPFPDPLGPLLLAGTMALIAQGNPLRWARAWRRMLVDVPLTTLVEFAGLLLLGFAIDFARESFDRDERWPFLVLVPLGWLLGAYVLSQISLHHLNRNRLARCFCVKRPEGGGDAVLVSPRAKSLTGLSPNAGERAPGPFPLLMVCATANVDDRSATRPEWRRYQPFIFTPDVCGLQTEPEARFETAWLEAVNRQALWRNQPLLTLMSAVASAGAAVSPSMGSKTRTGLRSLIAFLNLRLGTWMPNPHDSRVRGGVRDGTWRPYTPPALGGGYDEFVPELFGLQRDDAPRAYVSDGGHYDNLGLLALLRARCGTIWCVDSQADKRGRAGQLSRVIELAQTEGLITGLTRDGSADDLYGVFGPADGSAGAGHAIYEVEYAGGAHATLIVVKLGLTPDSGVSLREFHARDVHIPVGGKFPYDSTFCRIAFSDDRVAAYCELGRENAGAAVRDYERKYPSLTRESTTPEQP